MFVERMGGGTEGGRGDRSPANISAFNIMPMGVAWKESTSNGSRPPPPIVASWRRPWLNVLIVNTTVFATPELHEKYAAKSEAFTSLPQMTSHKPFLTEISRALMKN